MLLRILNGSLFELHQLARERAGLQPAGINDATQIFMTQAVMSLSDSLYYPAPMLLQLDSFEQVQASVFQVARAPGQKLVYMGAILLIVGVFAMLYIKERRLWIWIAPSADPARLAGAHGHVQHPRVARQRHAVYPAQGRHPEGARMNTTTFDLPRRHALQRRDALDWVVCRLGAARRHLCLQPVSRQSMDVYEKGILAFAHASADRARLVLEATAHG